MEGMHTHEVNGGEVEGESTCRALTQLKDSCVCPQILDFFSHGRCIVLHRFMNQFRNHIISLPDVVEDIYICTDTMDLI